MFYKYKQQVSNMKTTENSESSSKITVKNKIKTLDTKKEKRLAARKRIDDYLAEKQLKENIGDFEHGF